MLALNRLFRQNICSFCWRCCSASVGPHQCFSERTLIWVLAGHTRFIFLLLSHLFPSLPSHLSAHQSAGSVARTAHGARRGLGDVLALRTTLGLRQPSVEGHFEADLDILFNFICGKSIFGKLLKTFFFLFFDPFSDESQTASSQRR